MSEFEGGEVPEGVWVGGVLVEERAEVELGLVCTTVFNEALIESKVGLVN